MVHITIKGTPPTTNTLYRRHGHVIYMTNEGKAYKEMCQWSMKGNKVTTEPLAVILEFYFPDERKRDLDNFNKVVLDSCTGMLWKDDSQIQELTLRKFIDRKNPRVEIFIM